MENSEDDFHSHCIKCIKILKCAVTTKSSDGCSIISCPLDCGFRFHSCKLNEHKLLCMNEKVPCINAAYGCPTFLFRKNRSKHLESCPASIIHCSDGWDRWPIYYHGKKLCPKNTQFDSSMKNQLDVALAMRDQRMLRRWCVSAAQGKSLIDKKFTISPSSSFWIYRKWQSSREYSYPPGLEQSVCNELCKTCKQTTNLNSNSLSNCKNNITRPETDLDSVCLDYNSLVEKENAGDSNNKQEKTELLITDASEYPVKVGEKSNGNCDLPFYSLDDVLQLSRFGTLVYPNSSCEGSIQVAIDSFASTCLEHPNVACQILDFKFRNPSSTPPWCAPLGLDLNMEPPFSPSNFMYTFLCSQEFRRDEYTWHYKNTHSEIHGGLNGWFIERCPLAQYGCKFARQRFNPAPLGSSIIYNEVLESFGVLSPDPLKDKSCDQKYPFSENQNRPNEDLNLIDLPFDVLQHVAQFLDSFSLANLSLTCLVLRDVAASMLKDKGLVHFSWEKHKVGTKITWTRSRYKKWFFSSHFSPVRKWTFDGTNSVANHLKTCRFYQKMAHSHPFDYLQRPRPKLEKYYSDPLKESSTKL